MLIQVAVPVLCTTKFQHVKTNMINSDRITRLLLAIVFVALYFTNLVSGVPGLALLITGNIFFLNNFTGFCPVYWMLGFKGSTEQNELQ